VSTTEFGGGEMLVKEVMTAHPTCCVPSDAAQTAAIIMRDEDTGIVPIVENKVNRRLVGVVTDRDLCLAVIAGRPRVAGQEGLDSTDLPIEYCMTETVISCKPGDDVEEVLKLMKDNQVRRILVVDDHNTVSGIVSTSDLMNRANVEGGETRETLRGISKPTGQASKPRSQSAGLSK